MIENLEYGTLCIYSYNNVQELVEFKYIGQTNQAIICTPGEHDTQSSWAVDLKKLTPLRIQPGKRYEFNGMLVTAREYVGLDEVKVENSFGSFFSTHESNLEEI